MANLQQGFRIRAPFEDDGCSGAIAACGILVQGRQRLLQPEPGGCTRAPTNAHPTILPLLLCTSSRTAVFQQQHSGMSCSSSSSSSGT